VAHLVPISKTAMLRHPTVMPPRFATAMFNPSSLSARAFLVATEAVEFDAFNRDEFRTVEMPAVNGTGSAQSVAKLYGRAATGDSQLGLSLGVRHALGGLAVPPTTGLRDRVLQMDTSFSLGFGNPRPSSSSAHRVGLLDGLEPVAHSDSPIRTPVSGSAM
jgi:hypothetical protein